MNKVFIAPGRYVQGKGVLNQAGELVGALGKCVMTLWDAQVKAIVGETILSSLKGSGIDVVDVEFAGDSTKAEAERIANLVKENSVDVVMGIGGGKTLDAAKAGAAYADAKIVTCPTVASNDSPTSSYTVWYDEDGNCMGFESWGVNPHLVLVDTAVIACAPVKTFVAGMGDALATSLESEACFKARGPNLAGGTSTMAARALARLSYDILLENGTAAKRSVERNIVTPAVEKVIEANVLLSGLGFESGGCATAHMVANCLPSFPECHGLMHGHEVGFGLITQLCLDDDMPMERVNEIVDFEIAIGLPVTFEDIGLPGVQRDRLEKIGEICAGPGSLCENHPFAVSADDIVNAMIAADALGESRKKEIGLRP